MKLSTLAPRAAFALTLAAGAALAALSTPVLAQQGQSARWVQPPAPDTIRTSSGPLVIQPINHASLILTHGGKVIYVDPVGGGSERYQNFPNPDLIVITDIHGDHMNAPTVNSLLGPNTRIIAPAAVRAQLGANLQSRILVMQNGQSLEWEGLKFEAVAMYNVTPERLQLHTPGRGDGYVITFGDKRVYIAGDTEPTPEMAALRDIDIAFLPMNQPFTMTPQQAADAVRSFRPGIVYPYHYRGSDLQEFERLVGDAAEVRIRDWYVVH